MQLWALEFTALLAVSTRTVRATRFSRFQGLVHVIVVLLAAAFLALFVQGLGRVSLVVAGAMIAWSLGRPFFMAASVGEEVNGYTRLGLRRRVTPRVVSVRATYGVVYGIFVPKVVGVDGRSLTVWSLATSNEQDARRVLARYFRGYSYEVSDRVD